MPRQKTIRLNLGLAACLGLAALVLVQPPGVRAQDPPPTADRRDRNVGNLVVLVEDERSFAQAVSRWDEQTFFPVLFDDGWYSALFIRAFKPATILRYEADAPGDLTADELMDAAAAHRPTDDANVPPPGLVIADPAGPHRAAALALAAGHHQPLGLIPSPSPVMPFIDPPALSQFNRKVMTAAGQSGVLKEDQPACLTLAGDYPMRYQIEVRGKKHTLAVDDLLGRDNAGQRHALVGRTFGSRELALYQAMCSLFLHVDRTLLFDDYTNRNGPGFEQYRFDEAKRVLADHMAVAHVTNELVTVDNFEKLTTLGEPFDMVWINSSGRPRDWELYGTGRRLRHDATSMPIGWPRVMYMVHSFSAATPHRTDNLAGRAMVGGAYWYFGAIHEPFLNGFTPPDQVARRAAAGEPLLTAMRQTPGMPFHRPWKLMLFGDPLMRLRDAPLARTEVELPDAFEPQPTESSHAMMGAPERVDWALRVLAEPESSKPGELALACYSLMGTEHEDRLAEVDMNVARRHPAAAMLVKQVVDAHQPPAENGSQSP